MWIFVTSKNNCRSMSTNLSLLQACNLLCLKSQLWFERRSGFSVRKRTVSCVLSWEYRGSQNWFSKFWQGPTLKQNLKQIGDWRLEIEMLFWGPKLTIFYKTGMIFQCFSFGLAHGYRILDRASADGDF